MAGRRRGEEGSGRPLRTESPAVERRRIYQERLAAARTPSARVSAASQLLRAAISDPATPDTIRDQAAEQAIKFLTALTDQVEAASQQTRGGQP
jgi:hypothetical protein